MGVYKYHPNLEADIKDFEETCNSYLDYNLSNGKTPNLALLCISLGIDIQTFGIMEKWNNYSDICKRVKTAIQGTMIDRSLDNKANTQMSIFLLKNHYGYVDKHEYKIQQSVDVAKLSTNELEEKLKEYNMLELKLKAKLVDPTKVEDIEVEMG